MVTLNPLALNAGVFNVTTYIASRYLNFCNLVLIKRTKLARNFCESDGQIVLYRVFYRNLAFYRDISLSWSGTLLLLTFVTSAASTDVAL